MIYYCRTCNEFICNKCKNSFNHQNHLMIHLDMENLFNNISIYGNIIQADIEENIENNNNLLNKENIIEGLEYDFLEQKNTEIIKKLVEIDKIYLNLIEILKNAMKTETIEKINESILEYNNDALKINQNINEALNNLDRINNNSKMSFIDFKKNFDLINSNETKLNELNKKISKYYICSEVNIKINNIYDKINDVLAEVIDINKLFGLEPKYYNALLKIVNENKNHENENSENDNTTNSNSNINTNENNININTDINDNNNNNSDDKLNNKDDINNNKDNYINELLLFSEDSSKLGGKKSSEEEEYSNKNEKIKKRKKTKSENKEKKRHKSIFKSKKNT